MSKASVSFETIKNELMTDEEFKSEYERLKPRYEIISQIINEFLIIKKRLHLLDRCNLFFIPRLGSLQIYLFICKKKGDYYDTTNSKH